MKYLLILLIGFCVCSAYGQRLISRFSDYYPLSEEPVLRYMSSYTPQETIIFETNPFVHFSLYNDFSERLLKEKVKHAQAFYISFRPTIRAYSDLSLPIRTPSFKFYLGTQHMFRIKKSKQLTHNYWGFSLESGHFSNGQNGSSFSEKYVDGTKQSDSMYTLINSTTNLSEMLNRKSGNFSVNLTELFLSYRAYVVDSNNIPKRMHSFSLGYVLYHRNFLGILNMGGITRDDAAIIGRHRFLVNYEYMKTVKRFSERRFSAKQQVEYSYKTHPFINPLRLESSLTFYPFLKAKSIGFVLSYIYGHDNFNYRIVDSGQQFSLGITWNQFSPFSIN